MNLEEIYANELHFPALVGPLETFPIIPSYEWLNKIPKHKKVWISLWEEWQTTYNLPLGYDIYIMSWHYDIVNVERLRQQRERVPGQIIALFDGIFYDLSLPGVTLARYIYWSKACNKIVKWFPEPEIKLSPKFKFSAICNRVTQHKVWITTKLLETARHDSIIKLGDWIEEKNVHDWQHTGCSELDELTDIFLAKYAGKTISIDAFDNELHNRQRLTSDPWQFHVQGGALNLTNESFGYSYMIDSKGAESIYPGPYLTEKTLKCLVGGCPILAVGQFDTYRNLHDLGFEFDYGFDLGYDNDPRNLVRAKALIELIDELNDRSLDQLVADSIASSQHNRQWILDGGFEKKCMEINDRTIDNVMDVFR